jgi:hypothetical protein
MVWDLTSYPAAFVSGVRECVGVVANNATFGVCGKLGNVGVIEIMDRSNKSISSLGKTGKLLTAIIKVVGIDSAFRGFIDTMDAVVDFDYANGIWNSPKKLSEVTGPILDRKFILTFSGVLLNCASVFITADVLKKVGISEFKSFTRLSEQMGVFQVYSPKNILILGHIGLSLFHFGYTVLCPEGKTSEGMKKNREKSLSVEDLLKQLNNIGKVYLICYGATLSKTQNFKLVNLVTQAAAYILMVIK